MQARRIQDLPSSLLDEARTTTSPSPELRAAVEAVCVLLDTKPDFAAAQHRIMRSANALPRRIKHFDKDKVKQDQTARLPLSLQLGKTPLLGQTALPPFPSVGKALPYKAKPASSFPTDGNALSDRTARPSLFCRSRHPHPTDCAASSTPTPPQPIRSSPRRCTAGSCLSCSTIKSATRPRCHLSRPPALW